MKKFKKLGLSTIIALIVLSTVCMAGCMPLLGMGTIGLYIFCWFIPDIFHYDRYNGDYPHLYTVAINSVITEGYIPTPHSYDHADIYKLEEDEYGRELFIYFGSSLITSGGTSSVLICQAHDDEYAYWYENVNYALSPYENYWEEYQNGVHKDPHKGIPDESIEELKGLNDWGKEIDESRFSSAKIVRDPQRFSAEGNAESYYNGIFFGSGYEYRWCKGVARDKDGRALCQITGVNVGEGYIYNQIIAIMSPEGEFYEDGWFVYESPTNYAADLKRIKEATGWNMKAQ